MSHARIAARPLTIVAVGALALAGCSTPSDTNVDASPSEPAAATTDAHTDHSDDATEEGEDDMEGHDHAMDGGAPPDGIVAATDPTYAVGEEVRLTADHMPGMDGAEATITGAFDTVTYAVSYEPTDGGQMVHDHKWVVHEELENPGEPPLRPGTEVVILADHMEGMEGATGTIDSYTEETVYMVDVDADGMEMTNHKWVVESEIEALDRP